MRVNFGKYDIPPTLRKLTELWEELKDAERFYQGLHFYLTLGHFRYPCTPCDAVVFGNIIYEGRNACGKRNEQQPVSFPVSRNQHHHDRKDTT